MPLVALNVQRREMTWIANLLLQIGQVIQVYPHQVAIMGMIPALVLSITTQFFNYYTLCLLVILFLERKRKMVSSWSQNRFLLCNVMGLEPSLLLINAVLNVNCTQVHSWMLLMCKTECRLRKRGGTTQQIPTATRGGGQWLSTTTWSASPWANLAKGWLSFALPSPYLGQALPRSLLPPAVNTPSAHRSTKGALLSLVSVADTLSTCKLCKLL